MVTDRLTQYEVHAWVDFKVPALNLQLLIHHNLFISIFAVYITVLFPNISYCVENSSLFEYGLGVVKSVHDTYGNDCTNQNLQL